MSFNLTICEYAAYAMYHVHKATIDEIAYIIRKDLGKELVIPDRAEYMLLGEKSDCTEPWGKRHKIVVYLGEEQCKDIQPVLEKWKDLMTDCEEKFPDVGFIYVAYTDDFKHLESELCHANIFHPVLYDHGNLFRKRNHIPDDADFHAFLLDEQNTIMFIGSPVMNTRIWKEYKNIIFYNNLAINNKGGGLKSGEKRKRKKAVV